MKKNIFTLFQERLVDNKNIMVFLIQFFIVIRIEISLLFFILINPNFTFEIYVLDVWKFVLLINRARSCCFHGWILSLRVE